MPKNNGKEVKTGVVTEALPSTTFRVEINEGGGSVLAHLSGKMRLYHIKVLVGDTVKVEIDSYDMTKGRIIQRI